MFLILLLLLLCVLISSFATHQQQDPATVNLNIPKTWRIDEDDVISVENMFGANDQYFTVCRSITCCRHTLQMPAHAEKLML